MRTDDDWHPTVCGRVLASLVILKAQPRKKPSRHHRRDDMWRVCFWGADDTGMERDFLAYDEAKAMFDLTTNTGNINQDDLRSQGFHPA